MVVVNAYGLDKNGGYKKIMVFDHGGGTFDVRIFTIDNVIILVETTMSASDLWYSTMLENSGI